MKEDLVSKPQKVLLEGRKYLFEYDYKSLSDLEDEIGKGVYQIYDSIASADGIKLADSVKLLRCAMKKHHSEEEIEELKGKVEACPGLLLEFKKAVVESFVLPLLPPEILGKTVAEPKKKTKIC